MITVANRTETAARVKYAFDHGKIRIDELRCPSGRCTSTRRFWRRPSRRVEAAELNGHDGEERTKKIPMPRCRS